MPLRKLEKKYVQETVQNENFDYAFVNYSSFDEIEDEEFHRLRNAFLEARKALADYCEIDE